MSPSGPFAEAAQFGVVLFFAALASLITGFFVARIHPLLQERSDLRKKWLCGTGGLGFLLFGFARLTGFTGDILYIVGTANLLVFANLLGSWMATPLTRPAELVPLSVLVSLVDIFSVVGGPTREIAEIIEKYYRSGRVGPVPISDFILIKLPVPGFPAMLPVFGVSDWIIIAFFTASAFKFRLNDNLFGAGVHRMADGPKLLPYFPFAAFGLILAIAVARWLNIFIPALPMVTLTFLICMMFRHPAIRTLEHSDCKLITGTVVIMGVLMAARYFVG